jgi:SAM-dependent methyltransferase
MNVLKPLRDTYELLSAEYYDVTRHPTCRNFGDLSERFIVPRLKRILRKGTHVVDAGAGRSIAAAVMAEEGIGLDGLIILDSAPGMLAHSQEWLERGARAIIADARDTGLGSGSFDIIVASLGDPYNQPLFWRECARLLRRGGSCLFTTPTHDWASRFRIGSDLDAAEFLLSDGRSVLVPSFTPPDRDQITMIQQAGLRVGEVRAYSRDDLSEPISPKLDLGRAIPLVRGYTAKKP